MQPRFWEAGLVSRSILPVLMGSPVSGRVHSVFQRAVNVQLDGRLVSVTCPELGAMPNGIVVEGDTPFRSLGLVANLPVGVADFTLSFPDVCLAIGLSQASPWSPRLELERPTDSSNRCRRNLDHATSIAARRAPRRGFGPLLSLLAPTGFSYQPSMVQPICEYAHARIVDVIRGIEQMDLPASLQAATSLLGLGDGLTPSGDDFLVGFGSVLLATDHPLAAHFLTGCASLAEKRTTYLSGELLRYAARGEYAARLKSLLTTLLAGTESELDEQIPIALAWGSTSGADLLLGVLVGLAVRIGQPAEV